MAEKWKIDGLTPAQERERDSKAKKEPNRKPVSDIQVGDRVTLRYTVGISKVERFKVVTVNKITPSVIYTDNMRFSKTSLRGLDGHDCYWLLGEATAKELAAHESEQTKLREERESKERVKQEWEAKRSELQALIEPLGGFVRNAEHGEGWMIDGLSEDAIRRIGKAM
jgi:hypothetical protein